MINTRKQQRGFTLLEVLVALAITSVALIASLRAAGSMTLASQDLNLRSMALWSAENRLTQIRVTNEWPDIGERKFECPQGGIALACKEEVIATPNPNFRRVELAVFSPNAERSSAKLTGFAVKSQ